VPDAFLPVPIGVLLYARQRSFPLYLNAADAGGGPHGRFGSTAVRESNAAPEYEAPVLLCQSWEALTRQHMASLAGSQVERLYVRREDAGALYLHLFRDVPSSAETVDAPHPDALLDHAGVLAAARLVFEGRGTPAIHRSDLVAQSVAGAILGNRWMLGALRTIRAHDPPRLTHALAVSVFATALAVRTLGEDADRLLDFAAACLVHDVGMACVPRIVLNKPGRLSPAEMREVRRHPDYGIEWLAAHARPTPLIETVVLQHHERAEGDGYPLGLTAERIAEEARICALADTFDALTWERPYRAARSAWSALAAIRDEMLPYLTPSLYSEFVHLFAEG
jgi:hypothetical protein